MKVARVVSWVLAWVLLAAAPVGADVKKKFDRNDARGPLDVRSVEHAHGSRETRLVHTIRMQERWRSKALRGDRSYVWVWFSTDDEDRYAERRATIDYRNGNLVATMEIYEEGSDFGGVSFLQKIRVSRPTRRDVRISFARRLLNSSGSYSWSVASSYKRRSSASCRRASPNCYDVAPRGRGRGRVHHST